MPPGLYLRKELQRIEYEWITFSKKPKESTVTAVQGRRSSGTERGGGSAWDPPPFQFARLLTVDDYRMPGRASVTSNLTALSSWAGMPSSLRIVGAIWAVSTRSLERSGATPAPQTT